MNNCTAVVAFKYLNITTNTFNERLDFNNKNKLGSVWLIISGIATLVFSLSHRFQQDSFEERHSPRVIKFTVNILSLVALIQIFLGIYQLSVHEQILFSPGIDQDIIDIRNNYYS